MSDATDTVDPTARGPTPGAQTSEHFAAVKLPAAVVAVLGALFAILDLVGHPLSPTTAGQITDIVQSLVGAVGAYAVSRGIAKHGRP